MNLLIVSGDLKKAFNLSKQIGEFENPYSKDEYEKRLKDSSLILTGEIEEKVVGFKVGYDRYDDGSFYSWMGGVLLDYRRKGVASELAVFQEKWAIDNGYKSIKLKTRNKHEGMLAFAIERGFKILNYEPHKDICEVRIWMEKIL